MFGSTNYGNKKTTIIEEKDGRVCALKSSSPSPSSPKRKISKNGTPSDIGRDSSSHCSDQLEKGSKKSKMKKKLLSMFGDILNKIIEEDSSQDVSNLENKVKKMLM